MKKSDKLNTVDGMVQIVDWRKVDMGDRGAYMVTTKDKKIGLLFVDSDPDQPDRSVVAHVVGFDAKDCKSYRDGAIQMPVGLERAIAQQRLRHVAGCIMLDVWDGRDTDNSELNLVVWCHVLERGYAVEEMEHLLKALADGETQGLDDEVYVRELRQISADCQRLWPEGVDPDEDL